MVWPGPGLLLGSDFSLCLHMAESRKEQASLTSNEYINPIPEGPPS